MDRRSFLTWLGAGAAGAAVAPTIMTGYGRDTRLDPVLPKVEPFKEITKGRKVIPRHANVYKGADLLFSVPKDDFKLESFTEPITYYSNNTSTNPSVIPGRRTTNFFMRKKTNSSEYESIKNALVNNDELFLILSLPDDYTEIYTNILLTDVSIPSKHKEMVMEITCMMTSNFNIIEKT